MLIYRGDVVDGAKRERLCAELELVHPSMRVLHTVEEVCSALWLVHPDRALERARLEGITGIANLARVCSARVADVATLLQKNVPVLRSNRAPKHTRGQQSVKIQFWADPQFKHYMQRAGAEQGLDLSQALRVAGWEHVQKVLPRAATEGSARGPAVALVRPRRVRARRSL